MEMFFELCRYPCIPIVHISSSVLFVLMDHVDDAAYAV